MYAFGDNSGGNELDFLIKHNCFNYELELVRVNGHRISE